MNPYAIIGGLVGAILWTFAVYHYATGHEARKWEAAEAKAVAAAVQTALTDQKRIDTATLDAAVKAAAAEVKTITVTNTITKWAIRHVKDIPNCPDLDLVRLHDASALGADPASLQEGPSQPDGATAVVSTTAFSSALAENYGRCRVTAARLVGLQSWVREVCEK